MHSASTASHNAWAAPGPAEFDYRSDVVTTPTVNMLTAIQNTTLLDDVYNEDTTTQELEKFVSELTGKEAALLVLSGTMGNQVALRTHLGGPPHSVLCDHRAHVVNYEAGGASSLSGTLLRAIKPKNGHHITLEDVIEHAVTDDDVHACPTKVISLENTLNGTILPIGEAKKISCWARERDIIMHLDGARLWEAVASGAGDLDAYCSHFDSINLCFSKGLGAPIGSIIVGTTHFIKRARWVRKMLGGGLRQAGVVSSAAMVSVKETFLGGRLAAGHEKARRIGSVWEELGGKLHEPVETNMVWVDFENTGLSLKEFVKKGEEHKIKMIGGRFVIHYQISDESLSRLENFFRDVLKNRVE
jgi:threonine aldolase